MRSSSTDAVIIRILRHKFAFKGALQDRLAQTVGMSEPAAASAFDRFHVRQSLF
jgi:hypothetical protein